MFAKELLGLVGVYVCIFGGLFALAYVLDHLDGTALVIWGLIALLFIATWLGFGNDHA